MKNLARTDSLQNTDYLLLEGSPPAAFRLYEKQQKAILLIEHSGLPSGTEVSLTQKNTYLKIEDIIDGVHPKTGKDIGKTKDGDIVVFENAVKTKDGFLVGDIAARSHSKMNGHLQVVYMLARPTKISYNSKKGYTQFMSIIDPSASFIARTVDDLQKIIPLLDREWPNRYGGICVRDQNGEMMDFNRDTYKGSPETTERFIQRLIEGEDIGKALPLEIMPTWTLPMGREQVFKEKINIQNGDVNGHIGEFTSQYRIKNNIGFLPTLMVISDEEEWAFGGKTGKIARCVSSAYPLKLSPVPKIAIDTPRTAGQQKGRIVYSSRMLYKTHEDMLKAHHLRCPDKIENNIGNIPISSPNPKEDVVSVRKGLSSLKSI